MMKQNKILLLKLALIFILGIFLYHIFGSRISLSSNFVTNVVTFLSILFGFYITSFSIFTTSRYVAQLYKLADEENGKKQTLMDALIHKYKIGLILALLSICYVLVCFFFFGDKEIVLLNSHVYFALLIPFLLLNFIYGFEMMDILIKVIKQSAKLN